MKIGDRVLITKPKDTRESPKWIPQMDPMDGTIQTIVGFSPNYGYARFDLSTRYNYNLNWLQVVLPEESIAYTLEEANEKDNLDILLI